MLTTYSKKYEVLLVEDNPGDVRLTVEAFKQGKIEHHINVVNNGLDALNFLEKKEEYESAKTPDLILLDLNMPVMDGREFLQRVKQDSAYKKIPVCVLSTSTSEIDINDSYDLSANSYISKPFELSEYREVIKTIEKYWLQAVELPAIV